VRELKASQRLPGIDEIRMPGIRPHPEEHVFALAKTSVSKASW